MTQEMIQSRATVLQYGFRFAMGAFGCNLGAAGCKLRLGGGNTELSFCYLLFRARLPCVGY